MDRAKTEESMQGTTPPKVYNGEDKPSVTLLQPALVRDAYHAILSSAF